LPVAAGGAIERQGARMTETPFQQEYGHHLLAEVQNGRMTRRQLIVRASVIGLSATAVGRLLAACGGGGTTTSTSPVVSASPKVGGTMRVSMVAPIVALEPTTMYDTGSIALTQQVAEYLAWVNNDLTLRPVLAEKWEPDAMAKSWTFHLRQGVTFQDGKPFGADDVIATYQILLDPKTVSAALSNFHGILTVDGLEKVDDSTVTFHLDQAFVDFPYLVASTNYDCLIMPAGYKLGTWQKNPVGTGPFMLSDYKPKVSATFSKNPNYWQQGMPYLDGVQVTFNEETQAQALALQSGSIDMMLVTPVQGSQALFSDPNLTVLTTPSTTHREWHMRVDMKPYTDKRVRQALAMTLDRPALVQALFNGKAEVADDNIFCPLYPLAPKDLPQRAQDIAQAKQLLADAGYANGVDMTCTVEEYEEVPQFAQLAQQMAKQAGINLKLDQVTVTYYYGSGNDQPWLKVPMGITDWTFRGIPSQYYLPAFTSKGVWNSSHFSNPTFDKLAVDYDTTLDEASRRDIAKQMATLLTDETPAIIAYWVSVNRAIRKNVNGVTADPAEFLDLTKAYLT
jgi:peptide/nickel transport system substrate-binding protein